MDVSDLQSLGIAGIGVPTVVGFAILFVRGLLRNDQEHAKRYEEWKTERQDWERERRAHHEEIEGLYRRLYALEGRVVAQDNLIAQLTEQLTERGRHDQR